jgi:hypothetical protein
VGRFPGRAAAEHHALVLVSGGIDCRLAPQIEGGLALMVPPEHAWRARFELARYAEENRQQGRPALPLRPLAAGLEGVLVYCAVLFFLYGAPRRHAFSWDWWAAGTAQAGLITDGEWWRTVTALGLHADVGHRASNLFFGSVLGLLLAQALGSGFAWLAILLAGGLGNALGALLQPATHAAVGALHGGVRSAGYSRGARLEASGCNLAPSASSMAALCGGLDALRLSGRRR